MNELQNRENILQYFDQQTEEKTESELLKELSNLPQIEYDKIRKSEAKKLGIQLKTLDDEVAKLRPKIDQDESLPFSIIEPFHQSINPPELFEEISSLIQKFIILEPYQVDLVTLWIVFTWFADVVQISPLLLINAPEKACGKSQLLDLVSRLVARPLPVANCSTAALFRSIELWSPTLTIDEADTFFSENVELSGLINAGHTRSNSFVLRTVGEEHTPTRFSVWCPKSLAGIQLEKHLPSSTMSRGFVINLRRKLASEKVERLRHSDPKIFDLLTSKLARLSVDFSEQIREAKPVLPAQLSDREKDNLEPLLIIASVGGESWIQRSISSALKLANETKTNESLGSDLEVAPFA
jgi:putative DNA primase/helicase